jgi:hypothetical protein
MRRPLLVRIAGAYPAVSVGEESMKAGTIVLAFNPSPNPEPLALRCRRRAHDAVKALALADRDHCAGRVWRGRDRELAATANTSLASLAVVQPSRMEDRPRAALVGWVARVIPRNCFPRARVKAARAAVVVAHYWKNGGEVQPDSRRICQLTLIEGHGLRVMGTRQQHTGPVTVHGHWPSRFGRP